MGRPLIGISADLRDGRHAVKSTYAEGIWASGGCPVVLPPMAQVATDWVARCDGLILSGGDDPIMEDFGVATHAAATLVSRERQDADLALLAAVDERADFPVLGVCLGMQYMGLRAGAELNQHLPDDHHAADDHVDDRQHRVEGRLGSGVVTSWHHQALRDGGALEVVGRSPDGIVEAIADPSRRFFVGVQWHPERTPEPSLGRDLMRRLIAAARSD